MRWLSPLSSSVKKRRLGRRVFSTDVSSKRGALLITAGKLSRGIPTWRERGSDRERKGEGEGGGGGCDRHRQRESVCVRERQCEKEILRESQR